MRSGVISSIAWFTADLGRPDVLIYSFWGDLTHGSLLITGEGLVLALLGRGPLGPVFLGLGVAALALGIALHESSWFLAAVSIPGSAAGLVGAIVWATGDVSY
jgi:hypothetical protein